MGDFNEEVAQIDLCNFVSNFKLYNLIKQPTCNNSSDGKCIDLILTNKNRSFHKSNSFETGISDHHHLIYTMFRLTYEKLSPQIVHYRTFRNFSLVNFRNDLANALSSIFEFILDAHAPKKKCTVRGNHKPHMTNFT